MYSKSFAALIVLAATASASAQIQWMNQPKRAAANAQRSLLPVAVYVPGDAESRDSNIDRAQQRTLRNPAVIGMVRQRFIPLRLARTTQTVGLLRAWGVPTNYGMYMVIVPPGGFERPQLNRPLEIVDQALLANPDSLLLKLTSAFRKHRTKLFKGHVKPLFENEEAKDNEIGNAVQLVERFTITDADADLITLAERYEDNKRMTKLLYAALAQVSTPKSAEFLLDRAEQEDKLAKMALKGLSPEIAEQVFLPVISKREGPRSYLAYDATVKICRLGKPKAKGWWEKTREQNVTKEIDRVTEGVRMVAQKWRSTVGQYR